MPFDLLGWFSALASASGAIGTFWANHQNKRAQRALQQSDVNKIYDDETIRRATRYYIQPDGANVDPAQEAEMRHAAVVPGNLFHAIDQYLSGHSPHATHVRHLLLLADSGMGKTSFVLNYYARNQQLPPRQRQRLAVVPLGIPDALEKIVGIQHKAETTLFLDAFDEDTKAIQDHRGRLGELIEASREFRRVLITCRTQFFPSDEEIPVHTGLIKVGVTGAGEGKQYELWKMYLLPLRDEQVDQFLRLRYPVWQYHQRQQTRAVVARIPHLSVRPMLLSYIPDLLGSDVHIKYSYQLYGIMVEKWIEREDYWVEPAALREFSERLAVKLYSERQERGSERIAHTELQPLASQWGVRLDDWQLRGRSLLNRDAEGNYKFAHRSIMEYLALKRFMQGESPTQRLPLTDQMNAFLQEMCRPNIDLQRSYLVGADVQGAQLTGACLKAADLEGANLQGAHLEEADLKQANLDRANLQDVNLKGADLRGATLPYDTLKNATYDSRTRWPDELDHLSPGVVEWDTHLPTEWTNSIGIVFVQIPSGTFLMGYTQSETEANESTSSQHAVWLPQPFYLGKYPVTQGQWEAVMGDNPSRFTGDPDRPVESVSWEEVQHFLTALNQLEEGAGYCLPTEAQWEYACRAGSKSAYYFGDDDSQLRDYAWYHDNSGDQTHPVGQKPANPWGVHDMYGNVWEWVEDWYGPYSNDAQVNPSGPESGSSRVFRGGGWRGGAGGSRSAFRGDADPGFRYDDLGFRLARFGPVSSYPLTLGGEAAKSLDQRPLAGLRDPLRDGAQGPMMAWLPGGVFLMGEDRSQREAEQPVHEVELAAFSLGQFPVTFEEYDTFCEATGRELPNDYGWGRGTRPVISVTWEDATAYCEWLSEQTGSTYRLPTEAEWEYACRAESAAYYYYGDSHDQLGEYAWYSGNAEQRTHPVGEKRPNRWDLYDMHGNVWEWVQDWYADDYYQRSPRDNPSDPEAGSHRVIRGGSWIRVAETCRSAYRDGAAPGDHGNVLGFRVARDGAWPPDSFTHGGAHEDQASSRIEMPQTATNQVFRPFQVFQDHFADGERAPELVYIPGGTFTMGDLQGNGRSNEQPVHEVMLGAFAIGRYPITVAEYMHFVNSTGSHHPQWLMRGSNSHIETGMADRYRQAGVSLTNEAHPVVSISWSDAAAYCEWLSGQTGERYELPTEAQWEYACRAGGRGEYGFGSNTGQLDAYAWYSGNAESQIHPVGQKQPNAWGLYDMHGNVWEWVRNWYGDYSAKPQYNPSGPESGSIRVFRGGSWSSVAVDCRSASRIRGDPGYRANVLGFRLARRV